MNKLMVEGKEYGPLQIWDVYLFAQPICSNCDKGMLMLPGPTPDPNCCVWGCCNQLVIQRVKTHA